MGSKTPIWANGVSDGKVRPGELEQLTRQQHCTTIGATVMVLSLATVSAVVRNRAVVCIDL